MIDSISGEKLHMAPWDGNSRDMFVKYDEKLRPLAIYMLEEGKEKPEPKENHAYARGFIG